MVQSSIEVLTSSSSNVKYITHLLKMHGLHPFGISEVLFYFICRNILVPFEAKKL